MTNYAKGRAKEYATIHRLRAEGALLAQRTAGSHSPIDVIAVMPDGCVRLIQVKTGRLPGALGKLAEIPTTEHTSVELWHWLGNQPTIYK